MLLKEEHSRPTLYNLFLSTESLLNEENKRIIENINSLRSRNRYSPLYVGDGFYRIIRDRLTSSERKRVDWAVNNTELANKKTQQYIAERHTSRSAH